MAALASLFTSLEPKNKQYVEFGFDLWLSLKRCGLVFFSFPHPRKLVWLKTPVLGRNFFVEEIQRLPILDSHSYEGGGGANTAYLHLKSVGLREFFFYVL